MATESMKNEPLSPKQGDAVYAILIRISDMLSQVDCPRAMILNESRILTNYLKSVTKNE